jgi:ATP-dependent Clp protease protease subunit
VAHNYEYVKGNKIALLAQNIILLDDEIVGKMVNYTYECLEDLMGRAAPDVEVRIFTNGGSVRAGLDIYDALRRYPGKKTGVVYAYAHSMGAIILQACDDRVCLPHARVLIHSVNTQSVSLDVLEDPKRLKELRKSMQIDQQSLYAILVERTGKSKDEIVNVCKRDAEMKAEEALAFGLIDRIESFSKPSP